VNDRFDEQLAYAAAVPKLWDRMRDSIGEAIREFNERTSCTPNTLQHGACVEGKYCTRIHKAIDSSSIEVCLEEGARTLNISRQGRRSPEKICGYRITEDRKSAEFFIQDPDGRARSMSVDEACQRTIGEFIFTPFPVIPTNSHRA
jgi:hypothetical protein